MSISLDEVRHVARLARLELDEIELVAFQGELNSLLGHFQDIQSLDVSGLGPHFSNLSLFNVWSDDEPHPGLRRDQAFKNASVKKAGLFIVPTIIEE